MRAWLVETVAGWLLVLLGLFIFYLCAGFLLDRPAPHIVEAGLLTGIGFLIFRGGIGLLKVAMAARVSLQAQSRLEDRPAVHARTPAGRPSNRPATAVKGPPGRGG
jgi:hypothetical protein